MSGTVSDAGEGIDMTRSSSSFDSTCMTCSSSSARLESSEACASESKSADDDCAGRADVQRLMFRDLMVLKLVWVPTIEHRGYSGGASAAI